MRSQVWDSLLEVVTRRACSPRPTDLHPGVPPLLGPPLNPATLPEITADLGFAPPPLLSDFYTQVGNGGFGPGYGLMPLRPAAKPAVAGNAIAVHRFLQLSRTGDDDDPMAPELGWLHGLLPLVHLGCTLYVCMDCHSPDLQMLTWDCEGRDGEEDLPVRQLIRPTGAGFVAWLQDWASGKP